MNIRDLLTKAARGPLNEAENQEYVRLLEYIGDHTVDEMKGWFGPAEDNDGDELEYEHAFAHECEDEEGDYWCDECEDTGEILCPECDGFGKTVSEAGGYVDTCPECNGTKVVDCPDCEE